MFNENWGTAATSGSAGGTSAGSDTASSGAGYFNAFASITSAVGGVFAANAIADQGKYAREIFQANADFSRLQAEDTIRRGEIDAQKYKKKVKQLLGTQRANLAAQGVDVSGMDSSAYEIQKQTLEYGYQDVQTIRNNAFRAAWGLKFQASQYMAQGQNAELEARAKSTNTLLSSGMQSFEYGVRAYKDYKAGNK